MPRTFIYSYNSQSLGAKELSEALGIRRIKHFGSTYVPRSTDTIINWGSSPSKFPLSGTRVINSPAVVERSSNKLAFFKHLDGSGVQLVPWTESRVEAEGWLSAGSLVVARRILSGHSGAGIHILEGNGLDFLDAPLYTKYVKKDREFRVHVFRKSSGVLDVTDVQRKIKDPNFEGDPNWRVRNHQNGFIYVRNNFEVPEDVQTQAVQALSASGLDFGAVDVIWNSQQGKAYVLEINTAPGITGTTVERYSEAFKQALDLSEFGQH